MATLREPLSRNPFQNDSRGLHGNSARSIPILPSAAASAMRAGNTMDISPQPGLMGPPTLSPNPSGDRASEPGGMAASEHQSVNGGIGPLTGAAAAAQQPKVVQAAFIHKLYNMLEDQSIQHLISWSKTNDGFVVSASSEFSKVLAQYFKHTNMSSFVRQLNMYGFHKVSDVFHNGSPDSQLWEFKHGGGSFKRGDLTGLRDIKRRASRQALIHRESFSGAPKASLPPQLGHTLEPMPDPVETRLSTLEWNTQDLYARLARTEEAYVAATTRCQALLDGLLKCHQWNQDLSSHLLTLVPDPDNPVHRDVYAMKKDISRQLDHLRGTEEAQDPVFGNRQSCFPASFTLEPAVPLSPRQRPFDESRRPSLQATSRPNSFRGPVPPHLQTSPRRYGSIGSGSGLHSPSAARSNYPPPPPPPAPMQAQPQQPQQPHPLSNMTSPPTSLPRRHTSADIRLQGWQGGPLPLSYGQGGSPNASGQSSSAWPSSPRVAAGPGDQQLQDALAQYELPRASHLSSRQASPPPPSHDSSGPHFSNSFAPSSYANTNDVGWQLPGPRYPFRGIETSGPPTRRSSMASNVHSLLNPADTAEREGEDEGPDERKRKRVL